MRRVVLIFIIALVLVGCSNSKAKRSVENEEKVIESITKKFAETDFSTSAAVRIAVLDFKNAKDQTTDLEEFITDEVISNIFENKKFEVVERSDLEEVINEQKLALSGVVQNENDLAVQGVDVLCIGNTKEIGETVQITAKLISASTGKLIAFSDGVMLKKDLYGKIGNNNKRPVKIVRKRKLRTVIIK